MLGQRAAVHARRLRHGGKVIVFTGRATGRARFIEALDASDLQAALAAMREQLVETGRTRGRAGAPQERISARYSECKKAG
jgi:hypothetical protein